MKPLLYLFLSIYCFMLLDCAANNDEIPEPENSVYYWKTVFSPDSLESQFLKQYHVKKIYLRYFDVIVDKNNQLMPNATVRFKKTPSEDLQIIPTVFIVERCLEHNIDTLAKTLVDRILKMNETHKIKGVKEIEIDCDWTRNSQQKYFNFLTLVHQYLKKKNMKLSVTIRLHQLNMKTPPCDYGVLMLYNTGNYKDISVENPILGYKECSPYFKYIKDYKLPLCVAFPNFKWLVLFRKGVYNNIIYNQNLADTMLFEKIDDKTYKVIRSKDIPIFMSNADYNVMLVAGDTIRLKQADYNEIMKVKSKIHQLRPGLLNQIIIYDLNSNNINNINSNEYEKVFDFNCCDTANCGSQQQN
ncbi:MAG: hypothetical protein IKQ46_07565 [Bacteroidales bacterium]|nr:hypothetical protein [Bacteroidales bacterium]